MSLTHAADLRRRARRLRALATRIEQLPVMRLERFAGDDTWIGARPLLCRNLLLANQSQLHHEADQLRWQGYLFERRAAELETLAAIQAGRAS